VACAWYLLDRSLTWFLRLWAYPNIIKVSISNNGTQVHAGESGNQTLYFLFLWTVYQERKFICFMKFLSRKEV